MFKLKFDDELIEILYYDTIELNTVNLLRLKNTDVVKAKYAHYEDGSIMEVCLVDKYTNRFQLSKNLYHHCLEVVVNEDKLEFNLDEHYSFINQVQISSSKFLEKDILLGLKALFFDKIT